MFRQLTGVLVLLLTLTNPSYSDVELSGIVTSNDTQKPIKGVFIRVKAERSGRTLGNIGRTDKDGRYSIKIKEVDEAIFLDFNPGDRTNNAPDSVRLLSGSKKQQINKVLRAGNIVRARSMAPRSCPKPCCPNPCCPNPCCPNPCCPNPCCPNPCCPPIEKSEKQKIEPIPDGKSNFRKMSSNDRLKDALEKLASFEDFGYRLIQINNPDEFDIQMKKSIVNYMRNMPLAKELIYGEDQYSQGLYNALTRKREIVFSLYNLENIEQTRVNSPEPCCHVYKCKKRYRKSRKCRVRKKCWRR
ncbi:carboxypeptidase-like regulatory domain-containing protein [Gimesia aquarii]|uniref:Uncharacterized protein n=1 Tax=Gimesia aquarii TaxID=2527964 RepID=A0A517W0A0_9PLAN|nr:carboxypeptidase-like regulatory domain-containing protein [Gimesia aquarii]QDT98677.1 hypothetical protein V144x_41840 [Gimesia aquarii]